MPVCILGFVGTTGTISAAGDDDVSHEKRPALAAASAGASPALPFVGFYASSFLPLLLLIVKSIQVGKMSSPNCANDY